MKNKMSKKKKMKKKILAEKWRRINNWIDSKYRDYPRLTTFCIDFVLSFLALILGGLVLIVFCWCLDEFFIPTILIIILIIVPLFCAISTVYSDYFYEKEKM